MGTISVIGKLLRKVDENILTVVFQPLQAELQLLLSLAHRLGGLGISTFEEESEIEY